MKCYFVIRFRRLPQQTGINLKSIIKDGEVKQGIISSETGNSITLRVLGNPDEIIARENIEMMSSRSISVMPGGLENQIDIQAMADLLKFIKQLK